MCMRIILICPINEEDMELEVFILGQFSLKIPPVFHLLLQIFSITSQNILAKNIITT